MNNKDIVCFMILSIIKNTKFCKNLKIQKLIYIYEREFDKGIFRFQEKNFLKYKPYKFGPFSKRVSDLIQLLLSYNIVSEGAFNYKLEPKGLELLCKLEKQIVIDKKYFLDLCKIFQDANTDEMIKFVYRVYKKDLEKSIIINGLIYEEGDYERIRIAEEDIQRLKKTWLNKKSP